MKFLLVAGYSESLIGFRGELINRLLQVNIEVHIACPDISLSTREILVKRGVVLHDVPLQRTGTNPIDDLKTLFVLRRIMHHISPDAVLAYTIKPVIYGMLGASLARVPKRFALITGLGYAFIGPAKGFRRVIRGIAQTLYRAALAKSDIVFFQNPDDAELFTHMGITDANTQTRIVNGSGVDITQYSAALLPEKPVFLLIARLLGDKGVREYLEAAKIVKLKYPATQFDLVGWIDESPDAIDQKELEAWISEGVVNFKGKMKDVRPAIEACSVYVLPSYREGTPRTVLEAMAMGRAIITTDAPGCRETVIDGVNGRLVAVKAIDQLAKVMIELIESPCLVKVYGEQSRRIAEEKYDVHKVNDFMLTEMGLI